MKQTVIGTFSSEKQAEIALQEILQNDYANEEISIIKKGNNLNNMLERRIINELQGYTSYDLPEIGKTTIIGPLSERFHNNTDHDLTSILKTYGVIEEEARKYENFLASGKILLVVKTNAIKSSNVANVISQYGGKSKIN